MIGLAGVLLAVPFKSYKPFFGILLSFATCICIFCFIINRLEVTITYLDAFREALPIDSYYITLIMKMIGITYISEFASGLCKDAGYGEIASQIEMFAKISIIMISMPVFSAFLQTVGEFL